MDRVSARFDVDVEVPRLRVVVELGAGHGVFGVALVDPLDSGPFVDVQTDGVEGLVDYRDRLVGDVFVAAATAAVSGFTSADDKRRNTG